MSIGKCKECGDKNTYFNGILNACPMCGHEWAPTSNDEKEEEKVDQEQQTVDSNGTPLEDGDEVTVIKDLRVKGSSMVIKRGTKARIRLTDNPEEVDCRLDGTNMVLKTCFLKK